MRSIEAEHRVLELVREQHAHGRAVGVVAPFQETLAHCLEEVERVACRVELNLLARKSEGEVAEIGTEFPGLGADERQIGLQRPAGGGRKRRAKLRAPLAISKRVGPRRERYVSGHVSQL